MIKAKQSIEPQSNAANEGVAVELNKEALENLAGYLDVLIEMDLAQKISNEIRSKVNEQRENDKSS